MSNYTSCIFLLTQLIGFEKSDNGEKLTLPDQVEINTLIQFKNFLQDSNIESKIKDKSSYEMKMDYNESFWPCNHCTYYNLIEFNTCQMCGLSHNICVDDGEYFIRLRLGIREIFEQKNISDEMLHIIICECAYQEWVEELRLAVNVPRSSVGCCQISILFV